MANDNEANRLADWKTAAEKYCDLLDDMVKELRRHSDTLPATSNLKGLRTKSVGIEHEGKSFRAAMNRAVDSAPPSLGARSSPILSRLLLDSKE
jgi:hypothetical protein